MSILNVHFIKPHCKFILDTYNSLDNILTLQLWPWLVCFSITTYKAHLISSLDMWKQFCVKLSMTFSLSFVWVWLQSVYKKCYTRNLSIHTWVPVECRHYWAWWTLWAKLLPRQGDTPSSQSHWTQTWPHTASRGWPALLSSVSPASWGRHWLDSRPRLLGRWSRSGQCLMKSWLKTGEWWKIWS